MNTLEDRLRAALAAKSDGVAFSMLTRSVPAVEADPELATAPVISLPEPRPRPHQSRRIVATALAVAAVLLVAFGAVALHRATSDKTVGPAHVRPRSAIPWDQVGPGWTLVQETARTTLTNGDHPDPAGTEQVQLVDPSENRYQISSLGSAGWYLQTWDGQHRHAMFLTSFIDGNSAHPYGFDKIMVMDLMAGTQHTFTVPSYRLPPRFSGGDGQYVVFVDALHKVERYSLTGQPQQPSRPIPSSELVADSPDGRQAIVDSRSGLDVYDYASGRQVGELPSPKGYAGCYDPSWGGDGKLTANCLQAGDRTKVGTFVFSVNGVPAAGRPDPQYADAVGHRVTRFRQGVVATLYPNDDKNPTPDSFPALTHLTVRRLDTAGRTISIPVPAQLLATRSMIANSTLDAFTVVDLWGSSLGLSRHALSWNPFTGQVTELIHAATTTEAFVVVLPWGAQQY